MTPARPRPETESASLAYRLALAFAVALFILCALISYLLDDAVIGALDADLELELATEARALAATIAARADPALELREQLLYTAQTKVRPRILARILGPDGATVAESEGAARTIPAIAEQAPWTRRRELVRDADGDLLTIELYGDLRELEAFIDGFRLDLVLRVTPLLVAAMLVAYWVVRRTLRPLEAITAAAARVGSTTLGERLETGRAPREIARLTASFNAMLERLEDAFRRLQEFGADLAHELRTPLQNLRGEAEVALLNPRSPAEYREILGALIEECEHLARIVDDVLLLSRVERQEEALERKPFDLADEVEALREYFGEIAAARGLVLDGTVERPLPVGGDRLKLRRAIANIVDNALKYTPSGGRVSLAARHVAGDGAVEVVIEDTGPGIPAEHLPKVFQRFYRVEKSRSREFGGSGLGLGIARTLVRAHGGDVTIESDVGRGTRVRVRVPGG